MSVARGAAAAGNGSAAVSQNQDLAHASMNVVQMPTPFPGGSFLPPFASPLTSPIIAARASLSTTGA